MLGQLLFPNWTVMPRVVEHYQLLLQRKVLLFSSEQVIFKANSVYETLAYMATSGGHFSHPWGMGEYWSYSG